MANPNLPALRRSLTSNDDLQVLDALGAVSRAGPLALGLQPEVEALLDHEQVWVCVDAIRLLARTWGLPEHRVTARRLARDAAEDTLAAEAIRCVGWIYEGTGDPVVVCELVALLRDTARSSVVAAAAYMALQKVNDLPLEDRCEQVLMFDHSDFHLVDWAFVARVTERATARRRFADAPGEPASFEPTMGRFDWAELDGASREAEGARCSL